MSRLVEPSALAGRLDAAALEARGYKRCEDCGGVLPLNVSRCRRRRCPGYSPTWARDTMRKIRENLRTYGGLVAMCTLTAPGEAAGLVWDRENCTHPAEVRCDGKKGCKVVPAAAELWNEKSRAWWRELNRRAKLRADRAVKRLGYEYKGGLLMYEWELQRRGLWHLHFILAMDRESVGVRVRRFDARARAGLVLRLRRREAAPFAAACRARERLFEQVPSQVERRRFYGGHGDRLGGWPDAAELRQSEADRAQRDHDACAS